MGYKFKLKTPMSCDIFNVIYVVICSYCGEEYIEESELGTEQRPRDRVKVYRQHIRQPEYQQLKVENHVGQCGNGKFRIFPFLQLRTNGKDMRRSFQEKIPGHIQNEAKQALARNPKEGATDFLPMTSE